MLEKWKKKRESGETNTKEGKTRPSFRKGLLAVLFLSLVGGILLGFLLKKAIFVFFLPCAASLLYLLREQPKRKFDHPERNKFLWDYYFFVSLEKNGRSAMTYALQEMDISDSKDKIVADIESGVLHREDFLYDHSFSAEESADRIVCLFERTELEIDDIRPLRKTLPIEEPSQTGPEILPFLVGLFLVLLAMGYLGSGGTP